jgi:hypothetical protein
MINPINPILSRRFFAALFLGAAFACADTKAAPVTLPPGALKSSAGFYHPGVLVNRAQLDFIKGKVAAGIEPWKSAFEAAKASNLGALSYTAHP